MINYLRRRNETLEQMLFKELCTEFEALPEATRESDAGKKICADMASIKSSNKEIDISVIFALERRILQLASTENLSLEAELVCFKYKQMLDGQNTALLEKLEDNSAIAEDKLRKKIDFVLRELHKSYLFYPYLEKMQSTIIRRSIYIMLLLVSIVSSLIYMLCAQKIDSSLDQIATILTIAMTGSVGGYLSLHQRIQKKYSNLDPLHNYLELKHGQGWYFISPLLGGIFALLLFFTFKSKLISSEMFPKFKEITPAPANAGTLIGFFKDIAVSTNTDYAKVLIWSFVAGFAERFVPDTLEKLVTKSKYVDGGQLKVSNGESE